MHVDERHAIAASRKSDICQLNKAAIPKQKILQGRKMDEPAAESSIGNSNEALRTRGRATIEASIKNVLEPEAVTRLKSEMMTRAKKNVAKKAILAPHLREKKLQLGKGSMLEM